MHERQKMQSFDWLIFVCLVAVGTYLGSAIDSMIDLARAGSWWSILFVLFLFACALAFYLLSGAVLEFLSTGRFTAPKQLQKRRRPLALLLAVPAGIVIGIIGAQFGLTEMLV